MLLSIGIRNALSFVVYPISQDECPRLYKKISCRLILLLKCHTSMSSRLKLLTLHFLAPLT
ncbi:unnamed protein product, partial [Amoebophrya sp. A25]|eukprot:GSA25T00021975001.1